MTNWNEEQPEKKRARRYLSRERKGQLAMPGLAAPQAEPKKRKGARESAQKKLNKLPPRGR